MFPHFYFKALKFIFFVFSFVFFNKPAFPQKIFGDLSVGFAGGWWYYDQGKGSLNFDPALGNAYTESTPSYSFDGSMSVSIKNLRIGTGAGYVFFVEDDMYGEGNTSQQYNQFKISNGSVKFSKIFLLVSYPVLDKPKYQLRPALHTGIFWIDTIHPDKNNFGHKFFWEFVLENELHFQKFVFLIKPNFNLLTIHPKVARTEKEIHKIYSLGIQFGIRFNIFSLP